MAEINNLTVPQMKLFFRQLEELRRTEMRDLTIASLAGARYDKEGLDQLFKLLEA